MKPQINIELINKALADFLNEYLPEATVYENPNQQGTDLPAWWIEYVPGSSIKKQIGNRFMRNLHVVLIYEDEYNLVDLNKRYEAVAEILDENLELFKYIQDGDTYFIRTYERNWSINLKSLRYDFKLNIKVSRQKNPVLLIERATINTIVRNTNLKNRG